MTTKELLHHLVDALPESSLPTAERVLEELRGGDTDPLELRLLTAPFDDEAEMEAERLAVQQGREQAQGGQLLSDDEVWRQLGRDTRP